MSKVLQEARELGLQTEFAWLLHPEIVARLDAAWAVAFIRLNLSYALSRVHILLYALLGKQNGGWRRFSEGCSPLISRGIILFGAAALFTFMVARLRDVLVRKFNNWNEIACDIEEDLLDVWFLLPDLFLALS
jgi:hypothetical protein